MLGPIRELSYVKLALAEQAPECTQSSRPQLHSGGPGSHKEQVALKYTIAVRSQFGREEELRWISKG